ncbi:MAG: hypothetical protein ABJE47_10435 [bacterium]
MVFSGLQSRVRAIVLLGLLATTSAAWSSRDAWAPGARPSRHGFGPGDRVLLDAHNSYPEAGRWADRIDRALATGTPLAIEQDLYWRRDSASGTFDIVVAHDSNATRGAPTLQAYFFEKIRPIMERALSENRRDTWPLVILNLDFKENQRELHDAVTALLAAHDRWLTTAPRTSTPEVAASLAVGPLLVLAGADSTQRIDFHDRVPVGQRLRAFGAIPVPSPPGATRDERAAALATATPATLIAPRAGNYARWVNFPWGVVESGGQLRAGAWTATDSARLAALVKRAHDQQLWIRFYTLDGFTPDQDRGFTPSYNFGSDTAAARRWTASILTGVDFVATDQYDQFVRVRAGIRRPQRSSEFHADGLRGAHVDRAPGAHPTHVRHDELPTLVEHRTVADRHADTTHGLPELRRHVLAVECEHYGLFARAQRMVHHGHVTVRLGRRSHQRRKDIVPLTTRPAVDRNDDRLDDGGPDAAVLE